jgi:hypothetical protein
MKILDKQICLVRDEIIIKLGKYKINLPEDFQLDATKGEK